MKVKRGAENGGTEPKSARKKNFEGEGKPYREIAKSPALKGPKRLKLTPELIHDVCAFVACGGSLRGYCEQPGTPHIGTLIEWLARRDTDDMARIFDEQYSRALQAACAAISGDILAISDTATDSDSASAARVRIDARKWWLSKVKPSVYGDNVGLNVSGGAGITISLERYTTGSVPPISHNVRSAITSDESD
jgi:hypothetical protein